MWGSSNVYFTVFGIKVMSEEAYFGPRLSCKDFGTVASSSSVTRRVLAKNLTKLKIESIRPKILLDDKILHLLTH